MDGLALETEIVGVSSVSKSFTLKGKVNIEHHISLRIPILKSLKVLGKYVVSNLLMWLFLAQCNDLKPL